MKDNGQRLIEDVPAYVVGFTGISLSLAEVTEIAQQFGIIFGTILVIATLIHRIILIIKDLKK